MSNLIDGIYIRALAIYGYRHDCFGLIGYGCLKQSRIHIPGIWANVYKYRLGTEKCNDFCSYI